MVWKVVSTRRQLVDLPVEVVTWVVTKHFKDSKYALIQAGALLFPGRLFSYFLRPWPAAWRGGFGLSGLGAC